MRRCYLQGCVGQTYPVLFEQPKGSRFFGHAPNYTEVLAGTADAALHNQIRNVRITGTDGEILTGEILED